MLRELLSEKVHGSIDIGTRNVRALTLNKGKIEKISKKGIVIDEGMGERRNINLESTLIEIVEELGLKNKNVKVSISGQKFYSKSIIIKKEADIDKRLDLIHEELDGIVPNYDPLDFLTEEILIRADEEEEEILTISIEREKVEEILSIFTKLKVTVLKLLPDYIACYHLVEQMINNDLKNKYNGMTAVIDVGFEGTKIYFMDEYGIKMFINTLIGGREFTNIIREYKNTTNVAAEEIKKEIELGEESIQVVEEADMFTELTDTFKELKGNIEVAMDYFAKKNISSNVTRILLIGEGALLRGFKDFLQKSIRITTEYMDYNEIIMDEELMVKLEEYHSVEIANLLGNVAGEVS